MKVDIINQKKVKDAKAANKAHLQRYIFTLDTSVKGISLAFLDLAAGKSRKIVWQKVLNEEYASSSLIQILWQEGLDCLKASSEEMQAGVIATGPGSFTGIKVGLAWFYGMQAALSNKIAILETSALKAAITKISLNLLVDQKKPSQKILLCLANTQSYGYWLSSDSLLAKPSSFEFKKSQIHSEKLLKILQKEGLERYRVYVVGPWPKFISFLKDRGLEVQVLSSEEFIALSSSGMISLAQEENLENFTSSLPSPNYLRKSAAEENRSQ